MGAIARIGAGRCRAQRLPRSGAFEVGVGVVEPGADSVEEVPSSARRPCPWRSGSRGRSRARVQSRRCAGAHAVVAAGGGDRAGLQNRREMSSPTRSLKAERRPVRWRASTRTVPRRAAVGMFMPLRGSCGGHARGLQISAGSRRESAADLVGEGLGPAHRRVAKGGGATWARASHLRSVGARANRGGADGVEVGRRRGGAQPRGAGAGSYSWGRGPGGIGAVGAGASGTDGGSAGSDFPRAPVTRRPSP
jgi:hypothetical protein